MFTSLVGLNCTVKGLAGPTTAIFQASSIINILLNIAFFGLVPTWQQILGSIVTVAGVVLMFLGKH
jgi:drug/metabolite transporter (DMT)-like permease